jgi:hypothetical protein
MWLRMAGVLVEKVVPSEQLIQRESAQLYSPNVCYVLHVPALTNSLAPELKVAFRPTAMKAFSHSLVSGSVCSSSDERRGESQILTLAGRK